MLPVVACGPTEEEAAEIDQEGKPAAAEMADELNEMLGDEAFGDPLAEEAAKAVDTTADEPVPLGVDDEEAVEAAVPPTEAM